VGVDGKLDVGRIAAVIALGRPDIVALQELDVGRARSGRVDQAHEIAQRLGMRHHFNCTVGVEEEQYGDAVLTALPEQLVHAGPLPTLPRTRLEQRGALWVAVETAPGRTLNVVNTHLGLVPMEQRRQAAALLGDAWLAHPAMTGPTVLLGDFNATSRYAAYRALTGRLRDAQRGPDGERSGRSVRTFPSRAPILRIDHIFVSPELAVAGVEAVTGGPARVASDHLPLVASVQLAA
jgi:endonuclease/exonuclease/phosphatase family metal-dependent hydrolase